MKAGVRLIWITICLIICLSVLNILGRRGYRILYEHTYYTLDEVFGKKKSDFNTLIIGNSIFKFGVNPFYIDSLTGLSSVNLGYAATGFITQEFLVRAYLQNHTSPRCIILGYSPYIFYGGDEPNNKLPLYDYMNDQDMAAFFKANAIPYERVKYIPLYRYVLMDEYSRFGILSAYRGTAMFQLPGTYQYNGFYSNRLDSKKVLTFAASEVQIQPVINEKQLRAFYEIVNACTSNKIQLILVPYPHLYKEGKSVGHTEVKTILATLQNQNKITVLKDEAFNLTAADFSDGTHLTFEGSCNFSKQVGIAVDALIQKSF